ncbi:toll-like receptor 2 [Littorina saxatilis]|uniref:toll-like receptor 2 n=1 Tax=Littorina saxatilis TaxID=31220 RepID=UPI0038B5F8AF
MGVVILLFLLQGVLVSAGHVTRFKGHSSRSSVNIQHSSRHGAIDPAFLACVRTRYTCGVMFMDTETCGDSLCQCCGFAEPDKPTYATCSGDFTEVHKVRYIPQLPTSVQHLAFRRNLLLSEELNQGFFDNVTYIAYLVLAENKITWIDGSIFSKLTNLTCLSIAANPLQSQEAIRNALMIPGLQGLAAGQTVLGALDVKEFRNITTNVSYLWLGESHVSTYDMTVFCVLGTIRYLSLFGSSLKRLNCTCTLPFKYLDISSNKLEFFPETCTDQNQPIFPGLRELQLQYNLISSFSEELSCLPSLKFLDLSNNMIGGYTGQPFSAASVPKLNTLVLSNQCNVANSFAISDYTFTNPSLRVLILDGSGINFKGQLSPGFNKVFANDTIEYLSLAQNNFENVEDAEFLEIFGHLPLKTLILSSNVFNSFSMKTLSHFENLSTLYLASIDLSSVSDGLFDFMTSLKYLELSDNKITTIGENTFSPETRERLTFLSLAKNPFICSCDLLWFAQWYASNPRLFGSNTDYTCDNLPGVTVANYSLTVQPCLLSHAMNVAIIVTCSVLIVTLTTLILLAHFHWHIRLALYEAFMGRGDVRKLRLLADHFDYDVFVSYAKEDLPWVYGKLMPELEGRLGLRLCVHERDFIPGNNIVDNIVECVQSSKKILMVFSKDFVRSQWCQFELTYSMNHVMDYDDALIIVCMDDVVSHDMTAVMMAALRTTTYIQWEELEDVDCVSVGTSSPRSARDRWTSWCVVLQTCM